MLDIKPLPIDPARGVQLTLEESNQEFWSIYHEIHNASSWKLERLQNYIEPDDDSYNAMRNGEWLRSLELLEHRRDKMKREIAADLEKGRSFHRVRVVREPLSPYLQWELHSLKIDAECGEKVRIVDSTSIIDFETIELLPEVVVLGDQVLYQIEYSDKGLLTKELRFKDASLIASWAAFIEQLYHSGEDIISYFEKNVAHLPPPVVD